MKYFVITTKHHEGFCLWDSQHTDYKAPNTPAGRDLLREIVDAFRAEGLRVGFYYSLIDWHHPDFPIDAHHPLRNHPDAAKLNEGRDVRRYAAYMRDQVRELLTQYGPVDILVVRLLVSEQYLQRPARQRPQRLGIRATPCPRPRVGPKDHRGQPARPA
jgi:alpha-L-fucosidase